jgi:type I restriction enzyme, S subunit
VNAKQLIANFDRISDAVDASPRLRRFIVDLAVRGVLQAQDPSDEPASELLRRALAEKQLRQKRERTARKPLRELERSQVPFAVPKGWAWARLEMISRRIHYGYTASAKKDLLDVRLLRITDIQDNHVDWATVPGCVISPSQVEQYRLETGDILFARTGGTVGKTLLVEDVPVTAVFASYLIRVQPSSEMCPKYLKLFFESSLYWNQLREAARGAQPNVNGKILGHMSITVPPPAEQRRIVAKVDELMALCDELEETQTTGERRRDRLATSAQLDLVATPSNNVAFRSAVHFYLERRHRLITKPEHVSELRHTILDLAAQGKIVGATNVDTRPLGEMADFIMGQAPPGTEYNDRGEGTLFVKVGEFGSIYPEEKVWTTKPLKFAQKGDVLICVVGATVGKLNLGINCAIGRSVAAIRPREGLDTRYLYYSLMPFTMRLRQDSRGSAQGVIRRPDLFNIQIWCPDMSVQKAIVVKIEELMTMCDQLEQHLQEGSSNRERLLDAVLHEALSTS